MQDSAGGSRKGWPYTSDKTHWRRFTAKHQQLCDPSSGASKALESRVVMIIQKEMNLLNNQPLQSNQARQQDDTISPLTECRVLN